MCLLVVLVKLGEIVGDLINEFDELLLSVEIIIIYEIYCFKFYLCF